MCGNSSGYCKYHRSTQVSASNIDTSDSEANFAKLRTFVCAGCWHGPARPRFGRHCRVVAAGIRHRLRASEEEARIPTGPLFEFGEVIGLSTVHLSDLYLVLMLLNWGATGSKS